MRRDGMHRTAAHTPLPERLTTIHSKLSALIARHRPDCVAIEQLFFNTNATSALAVGHARGWRCWQRARRGYR